MRSFKEIMTEVNFYATVKSNGSVGNWEKLKAKTLVQAKKEASKLSGYNGDVIHLVPSDDLEQINDKPSYTKIIGSKKWNELQ